MFVIDLASKKVIHHYDTSNSQLLENFVRSIAQDSEGRFWIGTFGGGVGIYTPDMQLVRKFNQYEGFCSNTINQIYRSSKGQMWLATGEGLVCFPSARNFDYQVFQRKEGLPNTHIRAISEDKNGNIWASTNTGISCYITSKNVSIPTITPTTSHKEVSSADALPKTITGSSISALSTDCVSSTPILP